MSAETQRVQRLYELHKQLSTVTAKMNSRGFYFIEENRACMESMLHQEMEESIAHLRNVVGFGDNVPCTPTSMRAAIFSRHKRANIPCLNMPDPVNIPDFTNPTKECISIKKSPLLRLIVSPHATPECIRIVDAWWHFKKTEKRLGFVQSEDLLHSIDPEDNRCRAGFNSCGTDTGRFTCSVPNLFQIPEILRYMFGVDVGRRLVHADKKQMEIRVMACVADDKVLQERILSGKDLYETEARGYYNIPDDAPVRKQLRQGAKIGRLARQYGAQEKACFSQAIAADRTMTISRIRAIITLFDRTYHRTVSYWKEETERVAKQGYSESRLLGRRRHYPRMPDLAEIANWPIQATASDIANQEIIELDARLDRECPDAFLINHVYDSFDVDCPEDKVDQVTKIMREVSHRNYTINGIDFPFGIDLKVTSNQTLEAWKGDTWASV